MTLLHDLLDWYDATRRRVWRWLKVRRNQRDLFCALIIVGCFIVGVVFQGSVDDDSAGSVTVPSAVTSVAPTREPSPSDRVGATNYCPAEVQP